MLEPVELPTAHKRIKVTSVQTGMKDATDAELLEQSIQEQANLGFNFCGIIHEEPVGFAIGMSWPGKRQLLFIKAEE